MGTYLQPPYALISMANKDTYYVTVESGREVLELLNQPADFVQIEDIKSGATVALAVSQISSVVVREA